MQLSIFNKIFYVNNKIYYFFGLVLCTSSSCLAADWASVKKTNEYELLVDMDSYNETNHLPYITAKTIFKQSKNGVINGNKLTYLEVHATTQFNCQLKQYKTLETRYFKNKLLAIVKPEGSFLPLKPNSDHATTASLVCQVHKMLGGS